VVPGRTPCRDAARLRRAVSGVPAFQTRAVVQVLVILAGVALGVWALYELAAVVLVLIFAGLFAYVVAPLVQLAQHPVRIASRRRRLPRGAAIVLIYALTAGGVSLGGALLLPSATGQVEDMIASAPGYAQSIVAWEHDWSGYYDRLGIPLEIRRNIDQSMIAAGHSAVESARTSLVALAGALSNIPWLVLIPILGFFLLKDAASFRQSLLTALPHGARLHSDRLLEDLFPRHLPRGRRLRDLSASHSPRNPAPSVGGDSRGAGRRRAARRRGNVPGGSRRGDHLSGVSPLPGMAQHRAATEPRAR
jgi:AI-2E family transporter